MTLLRRGLGALWRLFVDDVRIAALIVGWIVVACVVLGRLASVPWSGPILFAGLAAIVAYDVGSGRRRSRHTAGLSQPRKASDRP